MLDPAESDSPGDTGGRPSIINGLLCSIMRARSRNASKCDLASEINRKSSETDINSAWTMLFSLFSDALDKNQKKKIIDIKRETTLKQVEDILSQLDYISENNPDSVSLLMPWDYCVKEFETDIERRAKIWEQEKSNESSMKLNELDQKLEKKHADLVNEIHRWSYSICNLLNVRPEYLPVPIGQPLTYANILNGPNGRSTFTQPQLASRPSQQNLAAAKNNNRDRSSSKRRRTEDGSVFEVEGGHLAPPNNVSGQNKQPQNKNGAKAKAIIGTSDSRANGRKMQAPPANIFVWGVHPSTSVEDIVNDLKESGIEISNSDVEKKSKPEANLCSYRISVPAALLDKALDPSIWPLRVRVREYIFYSNKPKQQRDSHQSQPQAKNQMNSSQGVSSDVLVNVPTFSRFDALRNARLSESSSNNGYLC